MRATLSTAALAAIVPLVAGHGHLQTITVNGKVTTLQGPDWVYQATTKDPSWRGGNQDNGFVASAASYINSQAVNCGRRNTTGGSNSQTTTGAYPALGSPVTIPAGTTVSLTWQTWAQHPGPTIDYLASCNGPCNQLTDSSSLKWFKIRQSGYLGTAVSGGWEASAMPSNLPSQKVTIPANLAPGEYVLRHEIIAVHGSGTLGGAQLYPQCTNINITGGGTLQPTGTLGPNLYSANDPGIYFNPYVSNLQYTIPGPAFPSGITNAPGYTAS